MRQLLIFAGALALATPLFCADPIRTVWIMAKPPSGATSAVERIRPDVHAVEFSQDEVIVRSAGISLAALGLLAAAPQPQEQIRQFVFRFPLKPEPASGRRAHVGSEFMGAFVNGVPIYNQFEAASYHGQNLWHYDLVARGDNGTLVAAGRPRVELTHASSPGLIEALIPDRGRHSPMIGFALDGYPIYGPWAVAANGELRRMRSSYRLRGITIRDRWVDGTRLAPGQYGPPVDSAYPLGSFVEDYEYTAGAGDLDQFNGRFAKTPEYPEGTYAYFLATDDRGRLAFPYLLALEYFGKYTAGAGEPGGIMQVRGTEPRIEFRSPARLIAGQAATLQFHVLDGTRRRIRYLEYVHERPVHLMVVSHDRKQFDHIHPEVNEHGEWLVRHAFPQPGRYRLYADFTPPGANQQIHSFDVTVQGPASKSTAAQSGAGLAVTLDAVRSLRAGEDVEIGFQLLSTAGLQPYLGAWAHVAIAGEGLRSFIHAHPLMDGASPIRESEAHTHTAEALGPPPGRIRVVTSFPAPGLYKLWLQLQVGGRVQSLPFELRVSAATRKAPAVRIPPQAIRVRITPQGYEPARIEIAAGKAVVLALERAAAPNCGGTVVFPTLGISREIPLGGVALVEIPAQPAGEIRFTCGMGMYRGSIVASIAAAK